MRIAIFGQAPFGRDVTLRLAEAGHDIAAVYAPPDAGRPDPLAAEAAERGWPLFRHKRFRRKGQAIPELVEEYLRLEVELNVLPFTTVILPPEIVDAPTHGSLCFHPSKLPAYRGGSAIAWQIILGAEETAVTVFRPDDGVDTGPIVVQQAGIPIAPTDTAVSLYFDKLYPAGVEAMIEAVAAVASGDARFEAQSDDGASHQPLLADEHARLDWGRPARELDRLARGCDPNPGAWAELGSAPGSGPGSGPGSKVRLFGARLTADSADGEPGELLGYSSAGALRVAAKGGVLEFAKVRAGDAKKVPAAESGLEAGARLI
jgi:methionyl-tRNA formyltransferase